MPRKPEIGNIQLYPNRPLRQSDKNGYVLKFYCPIRRTRIRKNCGTRDRREARRVLRECQQRLLNGDYLATNGAITAQQALALPPRFREKSPSLEMDQGKTWDECYERYRQHRASRGRPTSLAHTLSRISMAERIFRKLLIAEGTDSVLYVRECFTLDHLEHLQERLLAGDEGRYEQRSKTTVNSTMGAVMAFVTFCHRHEWIDRVPAVEDLDVDEVMKGRPVTAEEFQQMLAAVPAIVGEAATESWKFLLRVLWESGFRLGDLLDFHWTDDRHIRPVWSQRDGEHATIVIPSTQKNGKHEVIPLLPGLQALLETVPVADRHGWVLNPCSFGRTKVERLSQDVVSRTLARIGEAAGIVVRQEDDRRGHRVKYASAHDLRRGCALRLINSGVSIESVMLVMRHKDYATTKKHYGAIRSAQSAAAEVQQKLTANGSPAFVGGLMGGTDPSAHLTEAEAAKLKSLLASL